MRNFLFAAVALSVLGACTTAPQTAAPVDDKSAATGMGTNGANGANTTGSRPGGVNGNTMAGGNPLTDPNSPLAKRVIFFDYDSYIVRDDFKPLVTAHAQYLAAHPQQKLTIEGNTDERGSREYNIALGQKRADAAKKMMTLMGVNDMQIETVSFGKEKPHSPGKDEASYADNRRDDLNYAGQ